MAKTKTKNIRHLPLVVAGYILFTSLVVATLLSTTIPMSIMLFDPRVLHSNVAMTVLALTVGSVLPVLLGYFIGDHAVKSKAKLSHHFNGVLFGLLAFWLMTIFAVLMTIPDDIFADRNMWLMLVNVIPGVCVAVVATVLSIMHVRTRQAAHDVLEYKPFSVALIGSIVVLPLWSLGSGIITNAVTIDSLISLALLGVLGALSYASLRKTQLSQFAKVSWSAVSVSVVYVTVYVSNQLVYTIATYIEPRPTMESQALVGWIGFILAIVGWIFYWFKQVRALK